MASEDARPDDEMGIGSLVYKSAKPDQPGIIVGIADEGITVLWVTNTMTLEAPAVLRDFDRFQADLDAVSTDLFDRITRYRGHAVALRLMARIADDAQKPPS